MEHSSVPLDSDAVHGPTLERRSPQVVQAVAGQFAVGGHLHTGDHLRVAAWYEAHGERSELVRPVRLDDRDRVGHAVEAHEMAG